MSTRSALWAVTVAAMIVAALPDHACGGDDVLVRVSFLEEGAETETTIDGRILVEATDGGLLVEDRSGELWSITPDRLRARETVEDGFVAFDADELGEHLRRELGEGFTIVTTRHYVICTSADRAYAEWVGRLFERLQQAFLNTWRRAGLELHEPDAPLPAIVFRTQAEYAEFATRDAGPQLADAAGYFSIRTNRIVLYDLVTASGSPAAKTAGEVNRRVAAAPGNVATIVHEATHQIAFNSGMHTRYADNPMWLLEGMAMYCESPDLRTGSGWRTIGKLNVPRLKRFRDFVTARRDDQSLVSLISNEERFRDLETAPDAYAESWALTYFLIRTKREEMTSYLQTLAMKPRLRWDTPDDRQREFEAAFGEISELEREFLRYISRQGRR